MKILKCYAENFGTLNKFTIEFNSGLNTIMQENGWGKSTLAAFVKAMFYGIPSTTSTNLQKNERQKYSPWQGGKFGGYLEFEYKDKAYRIERSFGQKSSEDSFKLVNLKTGKDCKDFSTRIGDEIFGIDSDAYERSTYLPQKTLEMGANTSISAKLSRLVEDTDDINNYDSAISSLETRMKYLKKTGNKGKIADLEREIIETKHKIEECRAAIKAEQSLKGDKEKYEKDIFNLKSQLTTTKSQIAYANKNATATHYVSLKNSLTLLENELEGLNRRFKNSPPEHSTIEKHLSAANSLSTTDTMLDGLCKERDRIYTDCTQEDLKCADDCIDKAKKLALVAIPQQQTENLKKNQLYIILMIVSGIVAVTGIMLCIFNVLIVGLILLGIGLVAFGVVALMFFKLTDKTNDGAQLDTKKIKQDIEIFLGKYTLPPFNDYLEKLYMVKGNIEASLKVQIKINSLKSDGGQLGETLKAFLSDYGYISSNYVNDLYSMKNAVERYNLLQREMPIKKQEIAEFVQKNKIDESSITLDLTSISLEDLENTETELTDKIGKLIATIGKTEQQIDIKNNIAVNIDEYENALANLQEEKSISETKHFALENAEKFLIKAKETLSVKYISDMKIGFKKYFTLLHGNDIENFDLDSDLNIKIMAAGSSKDIDYFSNGSRDLIALCTRFALIDSMFKNEPPFIILDDPLINLDDKRTEYALELIKKTAENIQIVYLVCNTSRKV